MHQCSASRRTEGLKVHQNQHQKHAGEARGPAPSAMSSRLQYRSVNSGNTRLGE